MIPTGAYNSVCFKSDIITFCSIIFYNSSSVCFRRGFKTRFEEVIVNGGVPCFNMIQYYPFITPSLLEISGNIILGSVEEIWQTVLKFAPKSRESSGSLPRKQVWRLTIA